MQTLRHSKTGTVHAHAVEAELAFDEFFHGIGDSRPSVMLRCQPTWNAINDTRFVPSNKPVTCKRCLRMGPEVIVRIA